MLGAVVGSFLDSVTEREFDSPFMALLRHFGFYDIHFLHGAYEFGKDFIAKRRADGGEFQFVFQSKAGDLNLNEWAAGVPQIELLRFDEHAHPSFDRQLPRRAVLVLTGRLTGGAPLAAQDYCDRAAHTAVPLETWDRNNLIEGITSGLAVGLGDRVEADLLAGIANATRGVLTDSAIERLSRRWCKERQPAAACILEAALISVALRECDRIDLSCYAALCLVRAGSWHIQDTEPVDEEWLDASDLGRLMFAHYADELMIRLGGESPPPSWVLLATHPEGAAIVTYAVRCVRICELVGLRGLLQLESEESLSLNITRWLSSFIRRQGSWGAGSTAIISDRWAVSLIPAILLLVKEDFRELAIDQLRAVAVWISRRYSAGIGLAGPLADAGTEVRQVLGRAIGQPDLQRRDESYLASVLLDLLSFLRLDHLYAFARYEIVSAKALPSFTSTVDSRGQYLLNGEGVAVEVNAPYTADLPGNWTRAAQHLAGASKSRYLEKLDRAWDHLAVSSVLRDRHFVCAWAALIDKS